jgi:hypothetical protein
MSPDRLKKILDEQPFRPFMIHLGSGQSVRVMGREMALLLPGGRTLYVATGRQVDGDDEVVLIDVFLITSVTIPAPRSEKGRRKSA